jgi:class 3 adenylate cyclase
MPFPLPSYVNIAARTQQLSKHGQLLITSDVLAAPGVRELLGAVAVVPVAGTMKGVDEDIQVFEVGSN